jgi:hypothetical protein
MIMKYKDFKMLSQNEMKKVIGGDVPQTGCYIYCGMCEIGDAGPGCNFGGWSPIESCVGVGNSNCMGMFFHSCRCVTGPAM